MRYCWRLVVVGLPRIILNCLVHRIVLSHAEVLATHLVSVEKARPSLHEPVGVIVENLSTYNSAVAFPQHHSSAPKIGIHASRLIATRLIQVKPRVT